MKNENITFLLEMTKSYLAGKIDRITYGLDFSYEVETRYKVLLKEDRELAELIYDCLVEDGIYLYDGLSEEDFKGKIAKEYEYKNGVYLGDVDLV